MQRYTEHVAGFGKVDIPQSLYGLLAPITSEEQYTIALQKSEELHHIIAEQEHHPLSPFLQAVVANIVRYEEQHYPCATSMPHEILKSVLKDKNINQKQLAALIEVHQSTISRMITGTIAMDVEFIRKVSKVLDVPSQIFLP